jgi:superfamily I DNA/RNA helicase/RecB family exonuclease
MPVSYVLRRGGTAPVDAPDLEAAQRAVVGHPGGPLLVLAGPGTGKTTTLVETVVDRIERRGLRPDQVLVLTFSRKAAEELRTRITARLGRTGILPTAATFHSFCYGLVRQYAPADLFTDPISLLSAPEQDVRLRELLVGSRDMGTVRWPETLIPAIRTRGLAHEMQALFAQARAHGWDPVDLVEAGRSAGRPEWEAAGQVFDEYLEVLDAQGFVDYAELIHRAGLIAADPAHHSELRDRFQCVVVDEYQDTDPAQVNLLRALAGGGRDVIAVGDPDQSIYGFRGADVRALLRFPRDFPTASGAPAPVIALDATRRFGLAIYDVSRRVVDRLAIPGSVDRATYERFRRPRVVDPPYGDGRVEVQTFTTPTAEAERIADLLRRAHLDEGVPWSQMAVLVRSGVRSIPRLRRALAAADVPAEVAGDELPLGSEPAVQVLISALRVADLLHRSDVDPDTGRDRLSDAERGSPTLIDPDVAEQLLLSPLCGMDPGGVRRLARRLRQTDRAATTDSEGRPAPRPSGLLVAEALADPLGLATTEGGDAKRASSLAGLLARAREQLAAGAPSESALWEVWSGSAWPRRLRAAIDAGGPAARAAHRDLDAVCALFDLAARAEERQQRRGLRALLSEIDAQQIPAQTLAERPVRGDVVRLLTAHRSKGLEWRLVVVAGVQERLWPDLRHRGSLLAADRLGPHGLRPAPTSLDLLAEERRLFYVALTRARERLVVTAVASPHDDGEQPSRFLDDLEIPVGPPVGRPARPLSLRGLLGELRALIEKTDDPALRAEIARRIARLARAEGPAGPLLPDADPERWWGLAEPTEAQHPVRPTEHPVRLSGSAVDALTNCRLRWFLAREAGGQTANTTAQGFGNVVHALAAALVDGEVEPELPALLDHLDRVWPQLAFAAPWQAAAERAEAEAALGRLLDWHRAGWGREVLAAEHGFEVEVPVGDDTAVLRGSMDRVERDGEGRIVVVDLKTGKKAPRDIDLPEHPQLGMYQLAVRHGATDELAGDGAEPGGAELVHLRQEVRGGVRVQRQDPPGVGSAAETQLGAAVDAIRAEDFAATPGGHCGWCEFRSSCPAQPDGANILSTPTSEPDDG